MTPMDDMLLFARVVEQGSLTRAGESYGLSRSLVSKRIAALEARLGVRLLNRTTRRLSLTESGQSYYGHAVRVRDVLEDAEHDLAELAGAPRGRLRVNLPGALPEAFLARLLGGFLQEYPGLHLELDQDDPFVDLVAEGYDVAVRVGRLADSSMVARRVGFSPLVVCGSPDYLAGAGPLAVPDDLERHNCITYRHKRARINSWEFRVDGAPLSVPVRGNLRCGSSTAIRSLAVRGLGLVQVPLFVVATELAEGSLVEVLASFRDEPLAIHAIYPQPPPLPPKVRAFMDYLKARLADAPGFHG